MNELTIATILVFAFYTALSWVVLGPIDSISESYYLWKERNNGRVFFIFGLAVCVLCMLQGHMVEYKPITGLLLTMAGASMAGLTIASEYKAYKPHHFIPTFAAIGFGFAAVWVEFGPFTFITRFLTAGAGALALNFVPHKVTWQELFVMTCILTAFL